MYETGLPYCMDPHTLDTLGADTFNGALTLNSFAAHFRIDAQQEVRKKEVHLHIMSSEPLLHNISWLETRS